MRWLNQSSAGSSGTFGALFRIEADAIAFFERVESSSMDSRAMDEHLGTVFLFNKSITFWFVERLYDSIDRMNILFARIVRVLAGGWPPKSGLILQGKTVRRIGRESTAGQP